MGKDTANASMLRRKRIASGLNLVRAARELDTDAGNLSRIERGKQTPKIKLARKMASMYGITLDEVYSAPSADAGQAAP